jgi:hypothetical protein
VNADFSITDLLAAPLRPDWTIEGLAEQLLGAIAFRQPQAGGQVQELVLEGDALTDRQARRLLRPLLACLASKSAAETGTAINLFTGRLSFQRPGPGGPVWITGQFENRPGAVRVALRRSDSPPREFRSRKPVSVRFPAVFGGEKELTLRQESSGRGEKMYDL